MLARSARITQILNPLLGNVTITHPFHPLNGQNYTVLKIKDVNGSRLYSLYTDSGVICIPEAWTDRQFQRKQEPDLHMLHYNAFTLNELAQFIQILDDFSKTTANPIGNPK
jgi:hypothetical protein